MSIAFRVYVRCANCQRDYGCHLEPPEVEDAPSDIDELLESNYLRSQVFTCSECEYPIATVTGVKQLAAGEVVRTMAVDA